jgi:hypothetical protein
MTSRQWLYNTKREEITFAFENSEDRNGKESSPQLDPESTGFKTTDKIYSPTTRKEPIKELVIPEDRATWEAYIAGEVDHPPGEEAPQLNLNKEVGDDDWLKKVLGATACGLTCMGIMPLFVLL